MAVDRTLVGEEDLTTTRAAMTTTTTTWRQPPRRDDADDEDDEDSNGTRFCQTRKRRSRFEATTCRSSRSSKSGRNRQAGRGGRGVSVSVSVSVLFVLLPFVHHTARPLVFGGPWLCATSPLERGGALKELSAGASVQYSLRQDVSSRSKSVLPFVCRRY